MSDAPAVTQPVENGAATTPATQPEQPGHKVFAGNLSYSTTDESLKAFFAPVASDVLSTQIIYRGPRSAGYGFVAFSTAEAAQKSVELLNKKELDGRTVIVEVAKPAEEKQKDKGEKKTPPKKRSKKLKASADAAVDAVAGTTTGDVAEKAEEAGEGKPKKKRNARKGKKVKAAAEGEADGATPAADAEPKEPKEKKVKKPKAPKPPKAPRPAGETPEGEPSKTMLFVANLGFNLDDAALSELFTGAGITVVTARVVRRRWGQPRRSKGYGFVDVGSEEQQKKALEALQGKEIDGRAIAVKIAVKEQAKEELDEKTDAEAKAEPAAATA